MQPEREEEQKYIECAVVMVQSEREEEQKYIASALVNLQSEREEKHIHIDCAIFLCSLNMRKSRILLSV